MQIAIHAAGMPFNGSTIPDGHSLGGSESAAYYMAKELAALGHQVVVFTTSRETGRKDNVLYEWIGETSERAPLGNRFHLTMQAPYDVVIVQRHPAAFAGPINAKLKIWWLHDLALHRNAALVQQHLAHIDRIFAVSEFHRGQVAEVYGVDKQHIVATQNGVDYAAFDGLAGGEREPRSLIFAARPERGLEELVGDGGIMETLTDCRLYVCGYENTTAPMADYYRYLWDRCEQLPNVINLGALGKRALYERMARCMLYVYPTTFEDTSCIAAIEANAAGTPFVGPAIAALPETIGSDGSVLLPLKDGRVSKKAFVKTIRRLLREQPAWRKLHKKAVAKRQSWVDSAGYWSALFDDLLAKKSAEPTRLVKHLERMSDIEALSQSKLAPETIRAILPDFEKNYKFYLDGDYTGHYKRYYAYEKSRGVIYGPEDLTGNPRFEQIAQLVGRFTPQRVLDYGCAHGHYVMNLAHRFADMRFLGVDINAENIAIARKWAATDKDLAERTDFMVGTHEALHKRGTFDLIIAAEVLEHVPDPAAVVAALQQHLNPGGTLLISTPYGPWEAQGYAKNLGWRAHIHHFERQDLLELFGRQKNYKLMALPHGDGLGHFIVTFESGRAPLGRIDYARKLNAQAPRETVSACLIVKDGEHSLGKALQSIQEVADEIIIGIDRTTTDATQRVAEAFGADWFLVDSPLEKGFDTIRNLTIERARMDWILWLDADETLENAQNLAKYLRPNCFNGYAIKQHHYAVEPPALFKTDLPVRLFRNHLGVKFFGHVHEHPGKTFNNDPGKVLALSDVGIMHTGYSTEAVRQRRFWRNWPLMQKDREKYPERRLGKFLFMRDLALMIRYTLAGNGHRVDEQVMQWAQEAIGLWRELLALGETRLIVEGLSFYSEAVQAAGGGIEFALNVAASKHNGGARLTGRPLEGVFAHRGDIEKLTAHLVATKTDVFERKYF